MLLNVYDKIRLSVFIFHATINVCLSNFKKYEKFSTVTKLHLAVPNKIQTFSIFFLFLV